MQQVCIIIQEVSDANCAMVKQVRGVAAMAGALQRLVDDAGERGRLARAGLERARGFSWDAAVERTWDVYQELLTGRGKT